MGEKDGIMYEKISKIKIGSYNIPIRCDINVLGSIQDEFGTLLNFEQKLIGLKMKPDGTYTNTEPSIKAIAYALPLFVLEGIEQATAQGEDYSDIDWRTPLKDCDFQYIETALAMYEEFQRCFHRKKKTLKNTNPRKKATKTQLTSEE